MKAEDPDVMNDIARISHRYGAVRMLLLLVCCPPVATPVLRAVPALEELADEEKAIRELRVEIARHDELYFKKATPEISDAEYDRLKRKLRDLEARHPRFAVPAEAVGDDRTGGHPVASHLVPMLSLNKVYDGDELRDFTERTGRRLGGKEPEWVLEPKYDGLAISLTYQDGRLVKAVTRGNGRMGDDVTNRARSIRDVPAELRATGDSRPLPKTVELRGEIYLTYAEFDRINNRREEQGLEPYAHPRNLAVGTLKQFDDAPPEPRNLSLVIYGWGAWEPADNRPVTQTGFHRLLDDWGLPTVRKFKVVRGFAEISAAVGSFHEQRSTWPFPADGAVLKLNDVTLRETLGEGATAPNWAVAYKYPPDKAVTQIQDITLQVGRTGRITPVAELEPVVIGGTTLARASLHNFAHLRRLDVRVGDWVELEKAGEIIPQITAVVLERRADNLPTFPTPLKCPACQASVELDENASLLRCPNSNCPAQLKLTLAHFASVQGVDIRGLGPGLVGQLIDAKLLAGPADFYRLDFAQLEPVVGTSTARKLVAAIEASRDMPLARLIVGLGIPRVGSTTAKSLAGHFKSLQAFTRADALDQVPGLGTAAQHEVNRYLSDPENRRQLETLVSLGINPKFTPAGPGIFAGKEFVLTGKLSGLTRNQARDMIAAAGGVVGESVTRSTDFVVAGENAGAKLEEARRLGVPVIDEAELRARLKEKP